MKNIAVIFGGRSVEHDISILTGLHAANNIENARIYYVYMNRENKMFTGRRLGDIIHYVMNSKRAKHCWFANSFLRFGLRKVKIDAVLNCCHGGVGENGELAAFFKVVGIPVTSCDYVSAANMQSKIRTREILKAAGFEQPRYSAVDKEDYQNFELSDIDFPVIVKPDTLGSSIGITVARTKAELANALEVVFEMDTRAIVEEYFEGIIEINCAAIQAANKIHVSACERVNSKRDFLDYESKYLDSGSGFIKKGKEPENEKDFSEIKGLTRRAYELFGAKGVIRADFMIHNQKIYLNEINTIPGFLAYHLWARAGMPYALIINLAVKQAIEDAKNATLVKTVFKSDILLKNQNLVR